MEMGIENTAAGCYNIYVKEQAYLQSAVRKCFARGPEILYRK